MVKFYRENKQPDATLEVLRRRVDANPQNTNAIFDLASAYRAAGRERDMEQTLNEIRNSPERFPNGYELLANFYTRNGDYSRAMQALRAGQAGNQTARSIISTGNASCWFGNGVRQKRISFFEALRLHLSRLSSGLRDRRC